MAVHQLVDSDPTIRHRRAPIPPGDDSTAMLKIETINIAIARVIGSALAACCYLTIGMMAAPLVDVASMLRLSEEIARQCYISRRGRRGSVPFEVFDKRMAPLAKAPSVTIQKKGIFSFSKTAHKLIDEPATVELLYDAENEIIALRPSDEPHAYAMRSQGGRATGQVIMSASAFTQYYNIDTSVSRRFKPYEQDGMLLIDLRGPSVEISGNRAKQEAANDGT